MLEEIRRLARPAVLDMTPYRSARTEGKQEDVSVYLDANESQYPPHPGDDLSQGLNFYPKPQPPELLSLFSSHFGVSPERLMVTRGGDEAIDMLVRVFCREEKDAILITPPTFPMYGVAAQTQGAVIRRVPLLMERAGRQRDCRLDVDGILDACRDREVPTRLVFVCTPNNPTGGLVSPQEVLTLCTELYGRALVVADEAYVEFSGRPSLIPEVQRHPNLVVLRSLSKEYGLAGERCGITVAHPDTIDLMGRILAPYPIPRTVIRTVLRAVTPEGVEYARRLMRQAVEQRTLITEALSELPEAVTGIFRSDANYLLVETPDAPLLVRLMGEHGIKVRDRSTVAGIEGCVRFSVGTPEQNQEVLSVFRRYAELVARPAVAGH